jgi:hypothetical protein
MATIPAHLLRDRYWAALIHLFQNHRKLRGVFTTKYFDLQAGTVKIDSLKRIARPWSTSEKFMLNLALHLFNERNKVNLSDIDYLDDYNKKIAFEAMQIRFFPQMRQKKSS